MSRIDCFWYSLVLAVTFIVAGTLFPILNPSKPITQLSDGVFYNPETFHLNYTEMEKNFKVYVYPEGRPYLVLSPEYLFRSPYSIQHRRNLVYPFILKNILESQFWTRDPKQAHLFFLPFARDREKGMAAYDGRLMPFREYVDIIISKHPYWNRTLGANHFFLNCGDFNMRGVKSLSKNSIYVMCPSLHDNEFVPHKDVSLPPLRWRFVDSAIDMIGRLFWAESARDLRIFDYAFPQITRLKEYQVPKFCECSSIDHIIDSILNGCVPVIFVKKHFLPFSDILDWRKFSVIVKEEDFKRYGSILRKIEPSEFTQLRENLLQVQRHFVWNTPPIKYDAFHMVMYELWLRRQRTGY